VWLDTYIPIKLAAYSYTHYIRDAEMLKNPLLNPMNTSTESQTVRYAVTSILYTCPILGRAIRDVPKSLAS
jgi:hypothetical protein